VPYLLDGNNLIGRLRRTDRPDDAERLALIEELAGRLRQTRARAILFFDGPAGQRDSSLGRLAVRVPRSGSADDAIVRELERTRAPAEMIVVTADRELQRRVREAGGRICAPDEFFAKFGRGPGAARSDTDPERVDVAEWLRYFGDEGNRK
jgi:predicted RNA-binding protein with PIN domain